MRSKQHKILELFELLNNAGIGKAKNTLVVLDSYHRHTFPAGFKTKLRSAHCPHLRRDSVCSNVVKGHYTIPRSFGMFAAGVPLSLTE